MADLTPWSSVFVQRDFSWSLSWNYFSAWRATFYIPWMLVFAWMEICKRCELNTIKTLGILMNHAGLSLYLFGCMKEFLCHFCVMNCCLWRKGLLFSFKPSIKDKTLYKEITSEENWPWYLKMLHIWSCYVVLFGKNIKQLWSNCQATGTGPGPWPGMENGKWKMENRKW